jgi:uncharacterized integral membrane protein
MLRKLFFLFVLVPLALAIVALAVANRGSVTVSFDPFSTSNPAYAVMLPLYGVALLVLIAGVVVGGVAAWLKQRKWRRAVRRLEAENRALRAELESTRRRPDFGARTKLPVTLDQTPQAVLRSPAA